MKQNILLYIMLGASLLIILFGVVLLVVGIGGA